MCIRDRPEAGRPHPVSSGQIHASVQDKGKRKEKGCQNPVYQRVLQLILLPFLKQPRKVRFKKEGTAACPAIPSCNPISILS